MLSQLVVVSFSPPLSSLLYVVLCSAAVARLLAVRAGAAHCPPRRAALTVEPSLHYGKARCGGARPVRRHWPATVVPVRSGASPWSLLTKVQTALATVVGLPVQARTPILRAVARGGFALEPVEHGRPVGPSIVASARGCWHGRGSPQPRPRVQE